MRATIPQTRAHIGLFIVLEGGDHTGKSTQAHMLVKALTPLGREIVHTREPGGTPAAERIRTLILEQHTTIDSRAEALLFAASRADHCAKVIHPALERGAIVICDRFIDSSIAYQGAGRQLSTGEIYLINRWGTRSPTTGEDLTPHLTVVLDLPPEIAAKRAPHNPDRIELMPLTFHERVRNSLLKRAQAAPDRYLVIDGQEKPEPIHARILERIRQLL